MKLLKEVCKNGSLESTLNASFPGFYTSMLKKACITGFFEV